MNATLNEILRNDASTLFADTGPWMVQSLTSPARNEDTGELNTLVRLVLRPTDRRQPRMQDKGHTKHQRS